VTSAINSVSTISAGLKIRGDISGDCHLIVEGETHGKIHLANGRVTVGASGRVTADIAAPEIVIEGSVQGNLQARDNVRMGSASHVQGSVLSPRIRIEDGARFRGKVEMTRPGRPADASGAASVTDAAYHEASSTAIVGKQRG
jgi:cytoskeletal protein CcmA (bactofilin family)